jgi:8-oxo-dGTP pyrophosphatase MutT (NUDIX family)
LSRPASSRSPLYDDAVSALTRWRPPDAEQARLKAAYLAHLERHTDGLSRDCHPDHITASALVVSHDRRQVLLNLHRKYEIWVQFGGHCEAADRRLHEAALREAAEESGIDGLRLRDETPAQLSRHEVRCGPLRPSHHLDVRYVAVAPQSAQPEPTAESLAVTWFDPADLPAGVDGPLRELIAWALA